VEGETGGFATVIPKRFVRTGSARLLKSVNAEARLQLLLDTRHPAVNAELSRG